MRGMDELSPGALRAALVTAALAAVVILAGVFPDVVRWACLGVIALATLVAAAERRRPGGGWWLILGAGAGLSIAGAAIAQLQETVGGLIAVAGSSLVVIGAVIGFPIDES